MNEKREYWITLNVKQWNAEMDILKLFGDDIEIVDKEDETEKHWYCECAMVMDDSTFKRYMGVRKLVLK